MLGANQISKIIAVKNLSSLKRLEIGGNKIERIENFSNLNNINYLGISGNPIKSFSRIENLPSLDSISYLELRDYTRKQIRKFEKYFGRLGFRTKLCESENEEEIYDIEFVKYR